MFTKSGAYNAGSPSGDPAETGKNYPLETMSFRTNEKGITVAVRRNLIQHA